MTAVIAIPQFVLSPESSFLGMLSKLSRPRMRLHNSDRQERSFADARRDKLAAGKIARMNLIAPMTTIFSENPYHPARVVNE
ncbi:hypothetical protein [Paraburkholderia youngii]|uniref:hypothetical protein n=1 Tax=Paraburkholderia youngii TaxID=2782701 RepID=UPI003D1952D1